MYLLFKLDIPNQFCLSNSSSCHYRVVKYYSREIAQPSDGVRLIFFSEKDVSKMITTQSLLVLVIGATRVFWEGGGKTVLIS